MKVVLLTSDSLRHKYIAHCLNEQLDLALIVTEEKSPAIESTDSLNESDAQFVDEHFKGRAASEQHYFGEYINFPDKVVHKEVKHGAINSDAVYELICNYEPDRIILFGTSIIKNPLLSAFDHKIINLHLGLSPYFKGSATNLFPIYHKQLECIGATIHVATAKVDEGPILHQLRPDITLGDTIHDIGNKVILKSGTILPQVVLRHSKQMIPLTIQKGEGVICRIKDLSPKVLREIYSIFDKELVSSYLEGKAAYDNAKPIIEN